MNPAAATRKRQTPSQKNRSLLEEWSDKHRDEHGVTGKHHDLADEGLNLGDVYNLARDKAKDHSVKLDASTISSKVTKMTLDTLNGKNKDQIEELHQWFEWLEHRVIMEGRDGSLVPAPMEPEVKVLSLLERLEEIIKAPTHRVNLDPGKNFDGVDARVVDERSNGVIEASKGAHVEISLGGEIAGIPDDKALLIAVHDGRSNNAIKGDFKRFDEHIGGIVKGRSAKAS